MAFSILDGSAYFELTIPLDDFPQLLRVHMKENPTTPQIESFGEELVRADFPVEKLPAFVTDVCEWAGKQGYRTLPGILKGNTPEKIRDAFRKASSRLALGRLDAALTEVTNLYNLDVSFASKHLRFLRPDICPVFDSILRDALPYPFIPRGYSAFAKDCASLAKALMENQIANPRRREAGAWFVADVEAAIYIFARRAMETV